MNICSFIEHINNSIRKAHNSSSNLDPSILSIEGMSGKNTRHLYNNICNLDNINYLEVGVYKGSTFISSCYNNNILTAYAVDDFSETYIASDNSSVSDFSELVENVNKYIPCCDVRFINKSCFTLTENDIPLHSIDIYLYDGKHDYNSHRNAILYMKKFLSKICIIIIDDWILDEWDVKRGTFDGLRESNIKVLYQFKVPNYTISHSHVDDFWNGCGIFLCEI